MFLDPPRGTTDQLWTTEEYVSIFQMLDITNISHSWLFVAVCPLLELGNLASKLKGLPKVDKILAGTLTVVPVAESSSSAQVWLLPTLGLLFVWRGKSTLIALTRWAVDSAAHHCRLSSLLITRTSTSLMVLCWIPLSYWLHSTTCCSSVTQTRVTWWLICSLDRERLQTTLSVRVITQSPWRLMRNECAGFATACTLLSIPPRLWKQIWVGQR